MEDPDGWKARFRAPKINLMHRAAMDPRRGMVATRRGDVTQLYAWAIPTGDLTQLTHAPGGKVYSTLAPDGRWVYYLQDEMGDERGHYVRVPWEGGEPQDLTPDLPPYTCWF